MIEQLVCYGTGARCESQPALWRRNNPALYDVDRDDVSGFAIELIDTGELSLWRYRAALPFARTSESWRRVTLGEGSTALVGAGQRYPSLALKIDYAMPTASFKDRGAAVMICKALEWGVDRVATDSSGNAGTSAAAYAARTGMKCDVFVPSSASPGKLVQMQAHGATVHLIDGPRQAASDAVQEFVDRNSVFYASHVFNPYFLEGTKTFAYEVWEQLGCRAPAQLILPVGNGTLYLGVYKGFRELQAAGLIERMPILHAVQADACAPIARAWSGDDAGPAEAAAGPPAAEGIAIAHPPRSRQILDVLRATNGSVVRVSDAQIHAAVRELSAMGWYVEPTAAASFAAYKLMNPDPSAASGQCVIPLCGSGLKSQKR